MFGSPALSEFEIGHTDHIDGHGGADLIDEKHPFKTLYCSHCGHPHVIELSCGSRVCPKCRRKWFGYHFKALYKLARSWEHPRSLTLTVKNIPDSQFGRHHVNGSGSAFRSCANGSILRSRPRKSATE